VDSARPPTVCISRRRSGIHAPSSAGRSGIRLHRFLRVAEPFLSEGVPSRQRKGNDETKMIRVCAYPEFLKVGDNTEGNGPRILHGGRVERV